MIHLLIMMVERVGVIVILGFCWHIQKFFGNFSANSKDIKEKLYLFLFFLFSIISNYTGIEIQGTIIRNEDLLLKVDPSSSIANTRIMGVEMGGLLGGPFVGLGVGILAGVHRFMLGGVRRLAVQFHPF
ncbi:LytS/YhcK type 5TM receptor domain-containing protein [Priestia megaterium]